MTCPNATDKSNQVQSSLKGIYRKVTEFKHVSISKFDLQYIHHFLVLPEVKEKPSSAFPCNTVMYNSPEIELILAAFPCNTVMYSSSEVEVGKMESGGC